MNLTRNQKINWLSCACSHCINCSVTNSYSK